MSSTYQGRGADALTGKMTAIRQTLRSLARSPGYTVSAILTIALSAAAVGTGGGILYRTLAVPRLAAEPVVLIEPYAAESGEAVPMTRREYRDWIAQEGLFADSASRSLRRLGVNLQGGPRLLDAHYVSGNFFRVLRIPFAAGGAFEGNPNGVVIAHTLWMNELEGGEDAVGAILEIGERPYRVTGVTARGIGLPGPQAEIWLPGEREEEGRPRQLDVFARLPAGMTTTRAQTEADAVFTRIDTTREYEPSADAVRVTRLDERINEPIEGVLRLIGIALLTALACAALAFGTLLHLRRAGRRTDHWTRYALGGGIGHRLRQAAAEHAPIVAAGAAAALLLRACTAPTAQNLVAAGAPGGATEAETAVGAAITMAAAGSVAAAGAAIAWTAERASGGTASGTGAPAARGATGASLPLRIGAAAQVAVAVVLVHAGAAVYGGIKAMADIEALGIADDRVLSTFVDLRRNRGLERPAQTEEVMRLVSAAERIPGVTGAAGSLGIPGEPMLRGGADILHDHPITGERVRMRLGYVPVTGEYFAVTGIPILAGRTFDNRDGDGAEWATILSESAARMLYADQDPIDRMVYGLGARVVGVARDATYSTTGDPRPIVYRPITQVPVPGMNLLVNGRGDALPNAATVVETIRRANPDLAVEESTIVGAPPPAVAAERRARAWTIGAAALLILLQTVVTLYGAAAYAAARRTREYALKMAIGAARSRIAFDVLRLSLIDTAAGLAIATAVVAAADCHLETLAGGAAGAAPTAAVHAAALVGVAALATAAALRPALRATRVDPATVLTDDAGA